MKKTFNLFMLMVLVGTQFSTLFANVTYYASEVSSEEISETASEITSSEVSSEQTIESSEVVSETASGQATSETTSASQTETTDTEITAKITIDEDGVYSSKAKAARRNDNAVVELNAEENQSTYENKARLDAGSGESTINIMPTSKSATTSKEIVNKEVYYVLDENGNIVYGSTKQPRSYEGNLITVYNGTIVEADNAIARTSGGYDYSFYIYESIEDLKSNTDGVPISGGGFDATYIETIEQDGVYYDHIKISGYEGYVVADNVQIVPEELIQSRSYYTVENGDWVYYSAIDPVTSTEYDRMELGSAPNEAVAGTKYYSDDDVNFTTTQLITESVEPAVSYNSYFMNLPFRSPSSYTYQNYKSYLSSKGKSSSEYYNETSAFTKAQDYENVNSLMIFSMANHESAYGTSTYARACYNFFGRGAVDSDPDKACESYSYNTATDGILAQALFLQNGYFDVLDWRYSGTHVGNKASGMNVKYASDPDWGKKISNHAYMTDQYLGGKEEDKYAIVEVTGASQVYTSGSLSTKVKSSNDSGKYDFYDLSQMAGTSNTVNVVAVAQDSDAYQIYVPTSVKTSSSQTCSFTSSMRGSYPNYNGRTNVSVDTNTANYSCDYSSTNGSFSNGLKWIKKSNTKIISNKDVPGETVKHYSYHDNGKVKNEYFVRSSDNALLYTMQYNTSGQLIKRYTYQSGTKFGDHSGKIANLYYINNGYLSYVEKYNSAQKIVNIYQYYDGATLSNYQGKHKYTFFIDPNTGYITKTNVYENTSANRQKQVYIYMSGTKYGQHGDRKYQIVYLKPGTNYIEKIYKYNTNQSVNTVYTYKSGTQYNGYHGQHRHDVFYLKGNNMEIDYAINYDANNNPNIKYYYDPGTIYGKDHGSHIKSRYYY